MDVKAYMEKGHSLDDILAAVKAEYEQEQKKKNAANANKMKRTAAREKLMRAWRDYTIVMAEAMPADTPVDKAIDKAMAEVEETLRAFEATIDLLEAAGNLSKPKENKKKSDEDILLEFINGLKF